MQTNQGVKFEGRKESKLSPLTIKIGLATAPSTPIGAIISRSLPDGLPGLRRRLGVNPGGVHGRPADHHPGGGTSWLANRRVIVGNPTGGGPHHADADAEARLVLDLVSGHNIDQEIENISPGNGGGNVVFLQSASFVLLGVEPRPDGELEDEELAGLGEKDGSLGRYHPHVLVGLHDLLDAGQGELVVLEIVHLLDLLALVRPEHLQLLLLLLEEVVERRRRDGRRRRRGLVGRVCGGLGLLAGNGVGVVVVVVVHWWVSSFDVANWKWA